ncbi:hypothetical protein A2U01_0100424, partial [Trifolium medium]|nr:hypothetical protein [Trifolium medium]
MAFIEKELHMVGDFSSFASTSTEELQQKSLGHELKGLLLNYLLSSRQEIVDKNLASIEGEYTSVKEKL